MIVIKKNLISKKCLEISNWIKLDTRFTSNSGSVAESLEKY